MKEWYWKSNFKSCRNSLKCSGIAGGQVGAQALGAHQHTFCSF